MTTDPIEKLMDEHRVIERAADILEKILDNAKKSGKLDVNDLSSLVDFIRIFADKCHHGKEEGVLFPSMVEKGVPKEGGPIGVMLEEHDIGRDAVKRMVEAIKIIRNSKEEALNLLDKAIMDYTYLIRNHIQKEDNILFPMARNIFNEVELIRIQGRFNEVEERLGEGIHEKYEELIHKLSIKYLGGDLGKIHHHR